MRLHRLTGILPVTLLLVCAFDAAAEQRAGMLLERLWADHRALQDAQRDFEWTRERNYLGEAERADYAAYLALLRARIVRDCVALLRAGVPLPGNLPCPTSPASVGGSTPKDPREVKTDSERTAPLDAELDATLGEFDEMLLSEQARVKAARPPSTAASGEHAGTGGQPGSRSAVQDAAGDGGGANRSGDARNAREALDRAEDSPRGPGGGGQPYRRGARTQPADVPDGSDDDVVARQLREAAEKEMDPDLKEKLWDEYRRYKEGAG